MMKGQPIKSILIKFKISIMSKKNILKKISKVYDLAKDKKPSVKRKIGIAHSYGLTDAKIISPDEILKQIGRASCRERV